jgi:phosphomannomutase
MSELMISVAGIRGIIGDNITPDLFSKMASAFGSFRGGQKAKIILGKDSRISGDMLKNAAYAALVSVGCEVIDIGLCATPTVGIQIRKQKAQGGIMISASHNPIQWNALKIMWEDGIFMDAENGEAFLKIFKENAIQYADVFHLGKITLYPQAMDEHRELVLSHVDVEAIRARKFKVAYDPCNGAGGPMILPLLEKLGCQVFAINAEPTGNFAHTPEPLPENLVQLCDSVKANNADIGIATDPDVDRVAFVSEKGLPIGEENGLALVVDYVLGNRKPASVTRPAVAVNMSTTRAIEDVAARHGATVHRTKIGEANVARTMIKDPDCIIGGEGNGGVIYPPTHYGRDAAIGIALVLEMLAKSGKTLSEKAAEIPAYTIVKDKVTLPRPEIPVLLEKVQQAHANNTIDTLDGVKVNFKDSWVHVRPSGTEPIVRIIAEAKTEEAAKELCKKVRALAGL